MAASGPKRTQPHANHLRDSNQLRGLPQARRSIGMEVRGAIGRPGAADETPSAGAVAFHEGSFVQQAVEPD
jgi:hypothetical protein